jgi:hypothetical protein
MASTPAPALHQQARWHRGSKQHRLAGSFADDDSNRGTRLAQQGKPIMATASWPPCALMRNSEGVKAGWRAGWISPAKLPQPRPHSLLRPPGPLHKTRKHGIPTATEPGLSGPAAGLAGLSPVVLPGEPPLLALLPPGPLQKENHGIPTPTTRRHQEPRLAGQAGPSPVMLPEGRPHQRLPRPQVILHHCNAPQHAVLMRPDALRVCTPGAAYHTTYHSSVRSHGNGFLALQ